MDLLRTYRGNSISRALEPPKYVPGTMYEYRLRTYGRGACEFSKIARHRKVPNSDPKHFRPRNVTTTATNNTRQHRRQHRNPHRQHRRQHYAATIVTATATTTPTTTTSTSTTTAATNSNAAARDKKKAALTQPVGSPLRSVDNLEFDPLSALRGSGIGGAIAVFTVRRRASVRSIRSVRSVRPVRVVVLERHGCCRRLYSTR